MATDHERASDPERMTRGARRAFAILALAVLVLGMAEFGYFYVAIRTLATQQQASCRFAHDLGSAQLPAAPKPGKVGVQLVTDSRAQFRQLGCPGELPPPSPQLLHWAAYYHLPANEGR